MKGLVKYFRQSQPEANQTVEQQKKLNDLLYLQFNTGWEMTAEKEIMLRLGYTYQGEMRRGTQKGDVAKLLSFKHTEQVKYLKKVICNQRKDNVFNVSISRTSKEDTYDRNRRMKGTFFVHQFKENKVCTKSCFF